MLIDTHCHLNSDELYNDLEKVKNEAEKNNVKLFIIPSYTIESCKRAIEIAEKYDNCYAAIGFHPTEIKNYTDVEYQLLENNINHPKVIAVGEIGYDFHWDTTTYEEQKYAFERQIKLAIKYHKPIIIHCRDAIEACLNTLKENHAELIGGIMHSYQGSLESSRDFIKLGFYIGLGGPVTFKNAKVPKIVASNIDINYLLTETDSPYLTPHPYRGTVNSPKYISLIVKEMAELRNVDEKVIEEAVMRNVERLFRIGVQDEENL